MNIQYNLLTQYTVEFLQWVIQVILKLFCLKLGPDSFSNFFYYNLKDLWLAPSLQVKVSVVNSAGGSFCWNYATDNLCSGNVCCSYAGIEGLLQLCRWYIPLRLCWWIFLLQLLRWLFCCNYAVRSFCSIYARESFCSKYAGDNIYWNYAGGNLCSALCTWLFLLQLCWWLFLM